jgi:hypothetical protein
MIRIAQVNRDSFQQRILTISVQVFLSRCGWSEAMASDKARATVPLQRAGTRMVRIPGTRAMA